jgi:glycosyltransferase involved in cell wall biosynthesis
VILGFHTKQLTDRGTEVALFDYAIAAKELLGHDVVVFVPTQSDTIVPQVRRRFEQQFELVLYTTPNSISCDALYVIKRGYPGRITGSVPELNHAFEYVSEPHGHRFAAISAWLARTATRPLRLPRGRVLKLPRLTKPDVVPLIVTLPDVRDDLREELGIPDDVVVFGRHGGVGTFSIDFVKAAIRSALDERGDIWFVFTNVEPFYEHDRIVYLPHVPDRADVRRFVNTCDYMIHAHALGEGFGLAVAEFALVGAPVLTFLGSPRMAHLDLLSDGLLLGYTDYVDVMRYLTTLERRTAPVESDVAVRYGVERAMERFQDVFLR